MLKPANLSVIRSTMPSATIDTHWVFFSSGITASEPSSPAINGVPFFTMPPLARRGIDTELARQFIPPPPKNCKTLLNAPTRLLNIVITPLTNASTVPRILLISEAPQRLISTQTSIHALLILSSAADQSPVAKPYTTAANVSKIAFISDNAVRIAPTILLKEY